MSTYWADRFRLGKEPIPADSVTRAEYFELEREKIFRRTRTKERISWTRRFPEPGTEPVPTLPYVSPESFERERHAVFGRMWLNVGRVEEIPNPGDFFVKDLAVLETR